MATYKDFLTALLALGAKLPQLVPILLAIIDQIQQAIVIIQGSAKTFGAAADFQPTAKEVALEGELMVAAGTMPKGTFGAIGDGTLIQLVRQIWSFLKDNPEIMAFILSLLKKTA